MMSFTDPIEGDSAHDPSINPAIPLMQPPPIDMGEYCSNVFIDVDRPISQSELGQTNVHDNTSITNERGEDGWSSHLPIQESCVSVPNVHWETQPRQMVCERISVFESDDCHSPIISNKVTFLPEEIVLLKQYRHHYSRMIPQMTIRGIAEKVYKKLYISATNRRKILNLRQQIRYRFKTEGKYCRTHKQIVTYYYNQNRRRRQFERSDNASEETTY